MRNFQVITFIWTQTYKKILKSSVPLISSNSVFEQNYRFFNHDEFKNDLKDIPWDNILSLDDISASFAFDLLFARVNKLVNE